MSYRPNRILKTLAAPEMERMKEKCNVVHLRAQEQLWEQGDELTAVYMPSSAVISLLQTMSDGLSIEVASVGNEGIAECHSSWIIGAALVVRSARLKPG